MSKLLCLQFTSNLHYDKRYYCNSPIMNFPFICSNIPAAPTCGVYIYISLLISLIDGCLLTRKLLNQGFLVVTFKSPFQKFYSRHHDLVNRYGTSVSQMTTDIFLFS